MSSTVPFLNATTLAIVLYLLAIVVFALLLNRFLRALTNLLIKPAAGQSRSEQLREQQTGALASVVYGAASKVVWVIAILTALDKVGINPLPALALAGVGGIAIGFGAQNLLRDIISGFYIVLEDQYVVGDTVQSRKPLDESSSLQYGEPWCATRAARWLPSPTAIFAAWPI